MGRDESADVQLTDPWISHRHCEIDQIGDVLVVRDLDSKNGIFMHGHRVRESEVLSGEQLTVARTEIIVRYPGTAQAAIEAEAQAAKAKAVADASLTPWNFFSDQGDSSWSGQFARMTFCSTRS